MTSNLELIAKLESVVAELDEQRKTFPNQYGYHWSAITSIEEAIVILKFEEESK